MKKILIFGMPRSGTTLLQKHLAQSLNLWGTYKEPFSDIEYRNQIGDPYAWVSQISNGVIKVLAQNLDYIDLARFMQAGKFDLIVITKRNNLTDLCISLYYAEQIAGNYHYTSPPTVVDRFSVPIDFVHEFFLVSHSWYIKALIQIQSQLIDHVIFDYDLYQQGESQVINGIEFCLAKESDYGIDTVASKIDYSKACVNYNEIAEIIARENYN